MNKTEATKATRNGAIAASVSALLTLIIVLFAMSTGAEGKLSYFNDPTILFDVVFILVCAYGTYKNSRVASILILFHFIISKLDMSNLTSGLGLGIVFLYFYGKAVQGSFVYHKLEKLENPDYKEASKWTYIIGGPIVLVVVFFTSLGVMTNIGVFPPTKVLAKDEISTKYISTLISHGIIDLNDSVEYFYSEGNLSILEGGSILTQDRVIAYTTDEKEELQVYLAR